MKRKLSRFMIWLICTVAGSVAIIAVYVILSSCGRIEQYKNAVLQEMNGSGFGAASSLTIALIFFCIVAYICVSLYNLLSHRAEEDSRMHCLPLLMSPIFLIAENGLLHLFGSDSSYYQVTMQVISAIVVADVTFASLKFSFEISSKRGRFNETSAVKPDINLYKDENDDYIADISHNRCYLSGVFIGKIDNVVYADIKRYGHSFILKRLFFPNQKISYEKDE